MRKETVNISGANGITMKYGYDSYLRPNTVTYPDNEVVTTSYNSMGLPAKLASGSTVLVNGTTNVHAVTDAVKYDEAGRLRQMQFPAGGNLWQTRTYHAWNGSSGNGNGRLWEIRIGTSATETSNTNYNKLRLGYAYDSYGNIIASSEQFALGTWPQFRHCYDDQNRLVRGYHQYATSPTTIPSCTGLTGGQTYAYDKAGRLTSYEGATYNSYDGHAIQKSGYSYDSRGSLTSRAGNTLVWDHENRLQEVKSGTTVIESYLYDDNGIRVKRTAGGASTYFPSPYYELAGSTPIKYYFFGGQRVAQKNGSTLYYLHQDHLGSTVLTTGAADATKTYRAYGNQRSATGSIATRHQFTDQYLDDTGLVYMNARVRPSLLAPSGHPARAGEEQCGLGEAA